MCSCGRNDGRSGNAEGCVLLNSLSGLGAEFDILLLRVQFSFMPFALAGFDVKHVGLWCEISLGTMPALLGSSAHAG